MCQAIQDGGRRCPVHRRDSIVAIKLASRMSGLSRDVTENLFNELRQEGRHSVLSGTLTDNYNALMATFSVSLEAMGNSRYDTVLSEVALDGEPDAETLYALSRLRGASHSRAAALADAFSQISLESGTPIPPLEIRYANLRREFMAGILSSTDEVWNEELRNAAYNADLPHDRVSVSAMNFLRNSVGTSADGESETPQRRVEHHDLSERTHGVILSVGYDEDGGRMELTFSRNPETTYAYHSVPSNIWSEFSTTDARPMSVFARSIRSNTNYAYSSAQEAERDATRYRCEGCGQFRSALNHSCPEATPSVDSSPVRGTPAANVPVAPDAPMVPIVDSPVGGGVEEPVETTVDREPEPEPEPEPEVQTGATTIFTSLPPEAAAILDQGMARAAELSERALQGLSTFPDGVQPESADENRGTVIASVSQGEVILDLTESPYRLSDTTWGVTGLPDNFVRNTNMSIIVEIDGEGASHFRGEIETGGLTHNSVMIRLIPMRENPFPQVEIPADEVTPRWNFSPPASRVAAAQEIYVSTPDGQLSRTEFERNVTRSRAYAPKFIRPDEDARAFSPTQLTRWMSTRDLRAWHRANDGTVATSNIAWELSSGYNRSFVDEHGNRIVQDYGSFTVTGKLGVKRNEAGEMRVATGRHELRCSCSLYRQTYHCSHIDYVHSNGHRLAINMMPVAASARNPAVAGLFQSAIERRSDFSSRTTADGRIVGTFGEHSHARLRQRISAVALLTPEELNNENLDFDTYTSIVDARNSSVYLPRRSIVASALSRGNIEVELSRRSYQPGASVSDSLTPRGRWVGDHSVFNPSGTLDISRNDDGTLVISADRLRCSCGRFTSSAEAGPGTCPHIQRVAEYARRYYVNGAAGDNDPTYDIYATDRQAERISQRTEFVGETRIRQEMNIISTRLANSGTSVPDEAALRVLAAANVAEEVRVLEESARVEAERRERRRLEREEEERVASLSFQERAQSYVAAEALDRRTFLASHRTFARNLTSYRAAQNERWQTVEPGYGDDIAKARSDFEEELALRGTDHHLPPLTENVTDGICDPSIPGSRKFGVELEVTFDSNVNRSTALNNIIRDLREAGLTDQNDMLGYHSGRRSGWRNWTLERDSTVDGELVSPLLDDSPESWAQMGKALEILKRHGAKTSTRAGSHVHISSGSYVGSISKHVELMRTVQEHEDVIYRAAADPSKGVHRGTSWCGPNVEPPHNVDFQADFAQDSRTRGAYLNSYIGHQNMINLEGSSQRDTKAHIEFRMWDASLDLATIQQQVATSAALVEFADRRLENEGVSPARPGGRTPLMVASRSHNVTDEALLNATALADKIFRKQSDRKRFMAMFAINKWK